MESTQNNASEITQASSPRAAQDLPNKFVPKPRKPRMDARAYKKLFIRREVQVFKAQDGQEPQEPQRVIQVIKAQGDQDFQEEVGQNF